MSIFGKKKPSSELDILNSELESDLVLSRELAAPPEAHHIPLRRSETEEFLVVPVLLPSSAGAKNIEAVANAIVPLTRDHILNSTLLCLEIFLCRIPEFGPRKLGRIWIPRNCISDFTFQQVPTESKNVGESEIGCIWYVKNLWEESESLPE